MRSGENVGLQILALVTFVALRLSAPGWLLAIWVMSIVPVALVLLPTLLAIGLSRRERLSWPVALPCLLSAVCLVVAGAVVPDLGDDGVMVPLFEWLGVSAPHSYNRAVDHLVAIGDVAILGFLVALLWALVAAPLTGRNSHTPASPTPRSGS